MAAAALAIPAFACDHKESNWWSEESLAPEDAEKIAIPMATPNPIRDDFLMCFHA
jgi:hypothetical protein